MSDVYKAISEIQGELAKIGISKDGVNEQQKYKFRGIDQVYSALSPLLAKHGLCILPRMVAYERAERVSVKEWQGQRKETLLLYVTVEAEFDFVAVSDGSVHTIRTFGEAMDSGDKATNKAMSAAYKYAAFMAFAIPTEGDNDADSTTHDPIVAAINQPHASPPVKGTSSHPDFPDGPCKTMTALKAKWKLVKADLVAASDIDSFDIVLNEHNALLIQIRAALPAWWTGDGLEAGQGIGEWIYNRKIELTEREYAGDGQPLAGDSGNTILDAG